MGPTWFPTGADRTVVGPMLAQRTLLSGLILFFLSENGVILLFNVWCYAVFESDYYICYILLSKDDFCLITQFRMNSSTANNPSYWNYEIIVFVVFITNFSEYDNWEF